MPSVIPSATAAAHAVPSQRQPESPPRTNVAVPVIVSLLVVAIIIFGVLYALHYLREREGTGHPRSWRLIKRLSSSQHAAKITPFAIGSSSSFPLRGSSAANDRPRSNAAGTKMRIATRRGDGVWIFSDPDPSAPFTPSCTTDISPVPSPMSSVHSSMKRKQELEKDETLDPKRYNDMIASVGTEHLDVPPPAYSKSHSRDQVLSSQLPS